MNANSGNSANRTAAEALEKLIRLERNLEKKCHDLGYYNMIHVGLREFVEHAETFRAALAQPQEGKVDAWKWRSRHGGAWHFSEEPPTNGVDYEIVRLYTAPPLIADDEKEKVARRFEAYADDADQHALLMVPIGAETLRHAARLLRATQSDKREPDDPNVVANVAVNGESPAQSAPCLIVTRGDGVPLPDQGVAIEQIKAQALKRAASAQKPINEEGPLELGPQPAPGFHFDARDVLVANAAPSTPAQEPVATLEAKVSTLLARALTTGYGSTEAIYALANLAREPLFAAPPPAPAQKPIGRVEWYTGDLHNMSVIIWLGEQPPEGTLLYAAPQQSAPAQPVAWRYLYHDPHGSDMRIWHNSSNWNGMTPIESQPLYAAPPPDEARELRKLVAEQAEDDGLWFEAQTAPEAYLQQQLRLLHEMVEKHK